MSSRRVRLNAPCGNSTAPGLRDECLVRESSCGQGSKPDIRQANKQSRKVRVEQFSSNQRGSVNSESESADHWNSDGQKSRVREKFQSNAFWKRRHDSAYGTLVGKQLVVRI